MSGGRFNYQEFAFDDIADEIEREIKISGKPKTPEELKEESWRDAEWYERYPEDLNHHKYQDEVIKEFTKAVKILRMASIYAHRIDYLLSGDDGEETFLERLKEDLNKNYDL